VSDTPIPWQAADNQKSAILPGDSAGLSGMPKDQDFYVLR
jgi:hypothetical protein